MSPAARRTSCPLSVTQLEDRVVPTSLLPGTEVYLRQAPRIVTGAGIGGAEVRSFSPTPGMLLDPGPAELRLTPFGPGFTGGVNVATADVNADGVPDVVAGMMSGGSQVAVFDGKTGAELRRFDVFAPGFVGGVNVAAGDFTGDGTPDVAAAAAARGGPHVRVFDGRTGDAVRNFYAYTPTFNGGVSLAAADVNRDGAADLITGAGPGAGPHVKVFDVATGDVIRSFYAFDPSFTGGVNVAAKVYGGGASDLVVGMASGGTTVKAFSGPTGFDYVHEYEAYPGAKFGVRVAAADLGGGVLSMASVVTGTGFGGISHVIAGNGPNSAGPYYTGSFYAFDPGFTGGVSVAAAPVWWGYRRVAD